MAKITAHLGDKLLKLTTEFRGWPLTTVKWYKENQELTNNDKYRMSVEASVAELRLIKVSKHDEGTYTVIASSPCGEALLCTELCVEDVIDERSTHGETHVIAPILLQPLTDQIIRVGKKARFTVAASLPEVQIQWYKGKDKLHDNERFQVAHQGGVSTLDINMVEPHDEGVWRCEVITAFGYAISLAKMQTIVPKGYRKPEFLEPLKALLTEQGTVSLECKVVGVPTPLLRWYKDGNEIKAGDMFNLRMHGNDENSLGTYMCLAINCMGKAVSSAQVTVTEKAEDKYKSKVKVEEPIPYFYENLEDKTIRVGDNLRLTVRVRTPPAVQVSWFKNNESIEASDKFHLTQVDDGIFHLDVTPIELDDHGQWRCTAVNQYGQNSLICNVDSIVPKHFRSPEFVEDLAAIFTDDGLVSFECKVIGVPTPILRWYKDGTELKPGDVHQLSGNNSLGSYSCVAKNCMGYASSYAELTLEDIYGAKERRKPPSKQPPRFIQPLKDEMIILGTPFKFTVIVTCPPVPEVTWYKDNQRVDSVMRYKIRRERNGVYHLEMEAAEVGDQGSWKCLIVNDYGHSLTQCCLRVTVPKHFKKPIFIENLRAVLSEEGAVSLECKVVGVPQPLLKWYKDGVELKAGDIYKIVSGEGGTSCLGTYTCEARNCMGLATSTAALLAFDDKCLRDRYKDSFQQELSTIEEKDEFSTYGTPSITDNWDEYKTDMEFSIYDTPDITENEARQIIELFANEASEYVSMREAPDLPPLRFIKESAMVGNILMEALIIDVPLEHFSCAEEMSQMNQVDNLATEADIAEISTYDPVIVDLPYDYSDAASLHELKIDISEDVAVKEASSAVREAVIVEMQTPVTAVDSVQSGLETKPIAEAAVAVEEMASPLQPIVVTAGCQDDEQLYAHSLPIVSDVEQQKAQETQDSAGLEAPDMAVLQASPNVKEIVPPLQPPIEVAVDKDLKHPPSEVPVGGMTGGESRDYCSEEFPPSENLGTEADVDSIASMEEFVADYVNGYADDEMDVAELEADEVAQLSSSAVREERCVDESSSRFTPTYESAVDDFNEAGQLLNLVDIDHMASRTPVPQEPLLFDDEHLLDLAYQENGISNLMLGDVAAGARATTSPGLLAELAGTVLQKAADSIMTGAVIAESLVAMAANLVLPPEERPGPSSARFITQTPQEIKDSQSQVQLQPAAHLGTTSQLQLEIETEDLLDFPEETDINALTPTPQRLETQLEPATPDQSIDLVEITSRTLETQLSPAELLQSENKEVIELSETVQELEVKASVEPAQESLFQRADDHQSLEQMDRMENGPSDGPEVTSLVVLKGIEDMSLSIAKDAITTALLNLKNEISTQENIIKSLQDEPISASSDLSSLTDELEQIKSGRKAEREKRVAVEEDRVAEEYYSEPSPLPTETVDEMVERMVIDVIDDALPLAVERLNSLIHDKSECIDMSTENVQLLQESQITEQPIESTELVDISKTNEELPGNEIENSVIQQNIEDIDDWEQNEPEMHQKPTLLLIEPSNEVNEEFEAEKGENEMDRVPSPGIRKLAEELVAATIQEAISLTYDFQLQSEIGAQQAEMLPESSDSYVQEMVKTNEEQPDIFEDLMNNLQQQTQMTVKEETIEQSTKQNRLEEVSTNISQETSQQTLKDDTTVHSEPEIEQQPLTQLQSEEIQKQVEINAEPEMKLSELHTDSITQLTPEVTSENNESEVVQSEYEPEPMIDNECNEIQEEEIPPLDSAHLKDTENETDVNTETEMTLFETDVGKPLLTAANRLAEELVAKCILDAFESLEEVMALLHKAQTTDPPEGEIKKLDNESDEEVNSVTKDRIKATATVDVDEKLSAESFTAKLMTKDEMVLETDQDQNQSFEISLGKSEAEIQSSNESSETVLLTTKELLPPVDQPIAHDCECPLPLDEHGLPADIPKSEGGKETKLRRSSRKEKRRRSSKKSDDGDKSFRQDSRDSSAGDLTSDDGDSLSSCSEAVLPSAVGSTTKKYTRTTSGTDLGRIHETDEFGLELDRRRSLPNIKEINSPSDVATLTDFEQEMDDITTTANGGVVSTAAQQTKEEEDLNKKNVDNSLTPDLEPSSIINQHTDTLTNETVLKVQTKNSNDSNQVSQQTDNETSITEKQCTNIFQLDSNIEENIQNQSEVLPEMLISSEILKTVEEINSEGKSGNLELNLEEKSEQVSEIIQTANNSETVSDINEESHRHELVMDVVPETMTATDPHVEDEVTVCEESLPVDVPQITEPIPEITSETQGLITEPCEEIISEKLEHLVSNVQDVITQPGTLQLEQEVIHSEESVDMANDLSSSKEVAEMTAETVPLQITLTEQVENHSHSNIETPENIPQITEYKETAELIKDLQNENTEEIIQEPVHSFERQESVAEITEIHDNFEKIEQEEIINTPDVATEIYQTNLINEIHVQDAVKIVEPNLSAENVSSVIETPSSLPIEVNESPLTQSVNANSVEQEHLADNILTQDELQVEQEIKSVNEVIDISSGKTVSPEAQKISEEVSLTEDFTGKTDDIETLTHSDVIPKSMDESNNLQVTEILEDISQEIISTELVIQEHDKDLPTTVSETQVQLEFATDEAVPQAEEIATENCNKNTDLTILPYDQEQVVETNEQISPVVNQSNLVQEEETVKSVTVLDNKQEQFSGATGLDSPLDNQSNLVSDVTNNENAVVPSKSQDHIVENTDENIVHQDNQLNLAPETDKINETSIQHQDVETTEVKLPFDSQSNSVPETDKIIEDAISNEIQQKGVETGEHTTSSDNQSNLVPGEDKIIEEAVIPNESQVVETSEVSNTLDIQSNLAIEATKIIEDTTETNETPVVETSDVISSAVENQSNSVLETKKIIEDSTSPNELQVLETAEHNPPLNNQSKLVSEVDMNVEDTIIPNEIKQQVVETSERIPPLDNQSNFVPEADTITEVAILPNDKQVDEVIPPLENLPEADKTAEDDFITHETQQVITASEVIPALDNQPNLIETSKTVEETIPSNEMQHQIIATTEVITPIDDQLNTSPDVDKTIKATVVPNESQLQVVEANEVISPIDTQSNVVPEAQQFVEDATVTSATQQPLAETTEMIPSLDNQLNLIKTDETTEAIAPNEKQQLVSEIAEVVPPSDIQLKLVADVDNTTEEAFAKNETNCQVVETTSPVENQLNLVPEVGITSEDANSLNKSQEQVVDASEVTASLDNELFLDSNVIESPEKIEKLDIEAHKNHEILLDIAQEVTQGEESFETITEICVDIVTNEIATEAIDKDLNIKTAAVIQEADITENISEIVHVTEGAENMLPMVVDHVEEIIDKVDQQTKISEVIKTESDKNLENTQQAIDSLKKQESITEIQENFETVGEVEQKQIYSEIATAVVEDVALTQDIIIKSASAVVHQADSDIGSNQIIEETAQEIEEFTPKQVEELSAGEMVESCQKTAHQESEISESTVISVGETNDTGNEPVPEDIQDIKKDKVVSEITIKDIHETCGEIEQPQPKPMSDTAETKTISDNLGKITTENVPELITLKAEVETVVAENVTSNEETPVAPQETIALEEKNNAENAQMADQAIDSLIKPVNVAEIVAIAESKEETTAEILPDVLPNTLSIAVSHVEHSTDFINEVKSTVVRTEMGPEVHQETKVSEELNVTNREQENVQQAIDSFSKQAVEVENLESNIKSENADIEKVNEPNVIETKEEIVLENTSDAIILQQLAVEKTTEIDANSLVVSEIPHETHLMEQIKEIHEKSSDEIQQAKPETLISDEATISKTLTNKEKTVDELSDISKDQSVATENSMDSEESVTKMEETTLEEINTSTEISITQPENLLSEEAVQPDGQRSTIAKQWVDAVSEEKQQSEEEKQMAQVDSEQKIKSVDNRIKEASIDGSCSDAQSSTDIKKTSEVPLETSSKTDTMGEPILTDMIKCLETELPQVSNSENASPPESTLTGDDQLNTQTPKPEAEPEKPVESLQQINKSETVDEAAVKQPSASSTDSVESTAAQVAVDDDQTKKANEETAKPPEPKKKRVIKKKKPKTTEKTEPKETPEQPVKVEPSGENSTEIDQNKKLEIQSVETPPQSEAIKPSEDLTKAEEQPIDTPPQSEAVKLSEEATKEEERLPQPQTNNKPSEKLVNDRINENELIISEEIVEQVKAEASEDDKPKDIAPSDAITEAKKKLERKHFGQLTIEEIDSKDLEGEAQSCHTGVVSEPMIIDQVIGSNGGAIPKPKNILNIEELLTDDGSTESYAQNVRTFSRLRTINEVHEINDEMEDEHIVISALTPTWVEAETEQPSASSTDQHSTTPSSSSATHTVSRHCIQRTGDSSNPKDRYSPQFIMKLKDMTIPANYRMRLTCCAIGTPEPKVRWLKNGAPIDPAMGYREINDLGICVLEIPRSSPHDTAEYTCIASNDYGEATTAGTLTVKEKTKLVKIEPTPPRPVIDTKGKCGDSITVDCSVTGWPVPNVTWLKDEQVLRASDRVETSDYVASGAHRLVINNAALEDSGVYKCVATNHLGRDEVVTSVRVSGKRPSVEREYESSKKSFRPSFITKPHNRVVKEGDTVKFSCSVVGHPKPKAQWEKDGLSIHITSRIQLLDKDDIHSLIITDISPSDAGIYKVTVSNTAGKIYATAQLDVVANSRATISTIRGCTAYASTSSSYTRPSTLTRCYQITGFNVPQVLYPSSSSSSPSSSSTDTNRYRYTSRYK